MESPFFGQSQVELLSEEFQADVETLSEDVLGEVLQDVDEMRGDILELLSQEGTHEVVQLVQESGRWECVHAHIQIEFREELTIPSVLWLVVE